MKVHDMNDKQLHARFKTELDVLDEAIKFARTYGSARALHVLAASAERAAKLTAEMERRGLHYPAYPA